MTAATFRKWCFSVALALSAFFVVWWWSGLYTFATVVCWDVFCITYIAFSIGTFYRMEHREIRKVCAREDISTWLLFGLIVVASLVSLLMVLNLFNDIHSWQVNPVFSSIGCMLVIVTSWIMVHLAFTFRYAHLYYGDDNRRYEAHARGLTFPDDEQPDYFDFAYFSFVIGMTFQVSDVVITAKGVRRLVLLHSLIAFVFNTVIIALTVSQIVNFQNG